MIDSTETKGAVAKQYFMQGYNCSQAVALAFCKETGVDEKLTARLTIGFGGGIGRMREVCGALSGIVFVMSALYGTSRAEIYPRVQQVSEGFRKENGSIICRELLGLNIKGSDSPMPEERTEHYYKKRPCADIVETAANILEQYIIQNPPNN